MPEVRYRRREKTSHIASAASLSLSNRIRRRADFRAAASALRRMVMRSAAALAVTVTRGSP